jgi:drug efflux transport system ATP-binding protein
MMAVADAMESPATTAVLTFDGIGKAFDAGGRHVVALDDVSLQVSPGVVTGLIGPDGAGKTTLMRLAAGLLRADTGRVTVLGLDAERDALRIQASIGYMPQRFGLYEDLSVQENLDLYADLQGLPAAERPARYAELMHMTGLGPFTRRLAGRLSGGMKQKLGLACTLVRPPQLLLLDEPTVGVDPVSRRELWSIVYRLVEQTGMSVLLSTAYLDEAERCHEVVMLHQGRVLGQASPAAFSDELTGRSFFVTAPSLHKRDLQTRLDGATGVMDAVIQRSGVRLVMDDPVAPDLAQLLPGIVDAAAQPVPPRFEDAFVARMSVRIAGTAMRSAPQPGEGAQIDKTIPVIEVHELERRFGKFYAVRNLSFTVRRGEVFGLLGANGAGKSTTFRMLCGLLPPSGGRLQVAGVNLRLAAPQARSRIGYMSQKFSLYASLSVGQNLQFFSSAYGLTGARREARIRWAVEHFELSAQTDTTSGDLPLGFKQRLALACALMHEPDILFLDEPTSGVDPLARREFWRRINTLASQGVTVLVTTHFMEEAEYCDRLVIMAAGELLTLGTPEAIKQDASTAAVPAPNMEDAFIHLIEAHAAAQAAA